MAAFLIAVLGGVLFVRVDRKLAATLIICPFLFMIAFCLKYRVGGRGATLLYTAPRCLPCWFARRRPRSVSGSGTCGRGARWRLSSPLG